MKIQTFSIEDASKILCIKLPTTANALKSAYRRRSRIVHPDHSVAIDAKEQFQALAAAYEYAQTQPSWIAEGYDGPSESSFCEDGTPLSDLGQGLGPTTNGKPCDGCDAKGFTSYSAEMVQCPDCRPGIRNVQYRCRRCGGDGMFKRDGRAMGQCNGCRGGGWVTSRDTKRVDTIFGVRMMPANRCATCRGVERVKDPRGRLIHNKCYSCKGTGEILVFNPVIPKGLLGGIR